MVWFGYFATGMGLGIVFVKAEVLTWYRMQEMFRFQSFHMFGIIGVAVVVAALTQWMIRRSGLVALNGAPAVLPPKDATPSGARYWLGGTVFGLGWALLGACPGPIFTLIGAGHTIYVVPLIAAMAGTYLYAAIAHRLPH
jgi:uncharacterized membrane protein YedE/YeeE